MPIVPDILDLVYGETRDFSFDFSAVLNSGETISSITSVTADCSDLVISGLAFDDTNVYFTLSGGPICSRCMIKATVLTNSGETIISSGQLRITER